MLGYVYRDGNQYIETTTGEVVRGPRRRRRPSRSRYGALGPVDNSHQTFKYRGKFTGLAPGGREPLIRRNKWHCERIGTSDPSIYAQKCEWVGKAAFRKDGRRRKAKIVKTDVNYKHAYNKKYRAFREELDNAIFNSTIAKCRKKHGRKRNAFAACAARALPVALKRIKGRWHKCRNTSATHCKIYR